MCINGDIFPKVTIPPINVWKLKSLTGRPANAKVIMITIQLRNPRHSCEEFLMIGSKGEQ
jgi:hypothetical protein